MKCKTLNIFLSLDINFFSQIFRTLFFSIFFIANNIVEAQDHIIEEENFKIAKYHLTKNTDSSLYYIKKLKTSKNQCRVLFSKLFEAKLIYDDNKYEQCIDILNSILYEIENNPRPDTFKYSKSMVGKTYKESTDIIKLNVYRRFFYLRKNEERLGEAYDYLLLMQSSINGFPKSDFYYLKNKISISYSMASLKKVLGEVKESLDIFLEIDKEIDSIPILRNNIWYNDFQKQRANINVQIGRNYMFLEKENPKLYGLAELYYDKAYQITQTIDSTGHKNESANYLRKAELNYNRKNYNMALKLANRLTTYYKDKNENFNSGLYDIKARIYSKIKKHDSAIYYSNKLVNGKSIGLKYGFAEIYGILAENYYALNKIDSAYKYSQISLKVYNKKRYIIKRISKKTRL